MIDEFAKEYLHDDLRWIREAMLRKLDGLSEYDVRRPAGGDRAGRAGGRAGRAGGRAGRGDRALTCAAVGERRCPATVWGRRAAGK
jgi:hypothetical protein